MDPWTDNLRKHWFYPLGTVALVSLLIGVGVGIVAGEPSHIKTLFQFGNAAAQEPRPMVTPQGLPDFVALAKEVKPEVVNISTTQTIKETAAPSPFGQNDPSGEFWKRFFGAPSLRSPFKQRSLGSGFIIRQDGVIVTNYHVVDNADKITVRLLDGREFTGKVAGKDQKTDIALIKIDASDLRPALLGDSDQLQVGEWVMAVGNPFGLDYTVTSGIVSAKDREIGAGPYDHFIQTDTKINPGNSGGPLLNMKGEVVGIDAAIFSQSGGNIGIGFAIPINLVKSLLPQLETSGKVTRGWFGVSVQEVTPALAESLGLASPKGALVSNIVKNSPAERAGFKVGDVIVEYDGKEIKQANDLPFMVASTPVGKTVSVKVNRDKQEEPLSVTIAQLKEEEVAASTTEKGELGLAVQQIDPEIAESLGLTRTRGVVITAVEPGSVAEEAGLQPGDIIREINRKQIQNLSDYKNATAGTAGNRTVLFLIQRQENTIFLALRNDN